eukprot:TRINITY_DN15276_c0_g1_i1.p2 TRINITY_DN15276_c0_g1~~TRINITY_DN15276_c0_g1_i1.p2  ORF type:complete len:96 (-),score=13.26 TRINITY_DN15276_c0_g1_i1:54-341(-)
MYIQTQITLKNLHNSLMDVSQQRGVSMEYHPTDPFDKNPYQMRLDMEDQFSEQKRIEAEKKRSDPFGLKALLRGKPQKPKDHNSVTEDDLKQQNP